MKSMKFTAALGVLMIAAACGVDYQPAPDGDSGELSGDPQFLSSEAEAELEADLSYLREEEKLARDVYLRLGAEWDLQVFASIPRSEQSHMDSVKLLLDAYGFEDPIVDDEPGVFENAELAELYEQLVEKGLESELAALEVGATIEDLDIGDLQAMAERSELADVQATYTALTCGSRNHMRAFFSQLDSRGGSYEAQFISAAELQAIVGSERERCSED